MGDESIKRPTVVSLHTLAEGVRAEESRPRRSSPARESEAGTKPRPYDRSVKFISLKNSMNLGTIVRARSMFGA